VKLSSADVFIYIGAQLEPWAEEILRSIRNPDLVVIVAAEGIDLLGNEHGDHLGEGKQDHAHGSPDPHIWLDFAHDEMIVDRIAGALSAVVPNRRNIFQQNATIYKRKLRALDEKYRKELENCDRKTIILGGHAAFGYLARRYHLTQIALYGLSPDAKPTPRQLIEVIEIVKKRKGTAIFFEINVNNELARVIAKETGAKTLVLNPGASLTREQINTGATFLRIMEKNLENLKDGLRCR
jgi:zinc transport system substrate-binding protein